MPSVVAKCKANSAQLRERNAALGPNKQPPVGTVRPGIIITLQFKYCKRQCPGVTAQGSFCHVAKYNSGPLNGGGVPLHTNMGDPYKRA